MQPIIDALLKLFGIIAAVWAPCWLTLQIVRDNNKRKIEVAKELSCGKEDHKKQDERIGRLEQTVEKNDDKFRQFVYDFRDEILKPRR